MCLLKSLEHKLRQESACCHQKWSPLKLKSCSCEKTDETVILKYLAYYFYKRTESCFEEGSSEPIEEKSFVEEARVFSEVDRIVDDTSLSRQDKVILLSRPVKKAVKSFLTTFIEFAQIPHEILVFSLILLERFLKKSGWKLRSTNWRILLILSVRVAQKMEGHSVLTVKDMEYLYSLYEAHEFKTLERIYLQILDYDCMVSSEEFVKKTKKIFKSVQPEEKRKAEA